jgi:lipopolysaccharide biosynthesis glycosyltransferase
MKINLLLSADDRHAPYAAAVIGSVVESRAFDDRLHIYLLTLGLSDHNLQNYLQLASHLGVKIEVVIAPPSLLSNLPDKGRTKTAYLRMFSGVLLPNVNLAVYLDTDILVRCSLSELLEEYQRSGCPAAAIRDVAAIAGWNGLDNEVPAQFDRSKYFNSGVMVLDLEYMRRKQAHRVLPEIRQSLHHSQLHDQSALNVFYEGNVALLPEKYNYMLDAYDSFVVRDPEKFSFLVGAFLDPKIVHFSNYKKPWHKRFPQRFASEYRSHLVKTPWGRDALPQLTLRQKVGRVVRLVPYFRRMIAVRRIWLIEKLTR